MNNNVFSEHIEQIGPDGGSSASDRLGSPSGHSSQSEAYFRAILDNSLDGVVVIDAAAKVQYVNPAIERLFGYTPGEIIGTNAFKNLHPSDLIVAIGQLSRLLLYPRQPVISELRFRHSDGSYRWVEAQTTNLLEDRHVRGLLSNYRDITDRKKAERELAWSEEFLRSVCESSPDYIFLIDPDGTIRFTNRPVKSLTVDRLIGRKIFEFVLPELGEKMHQCYERVIKSRAPGSYECVYQNDNGELERYETRVGPVIEGGTVKSLVLVTSDITQRFQIQKRLAASECRFRELVETIPAAIVIIQDLKILSANEAIQQISGYSEVELQSMNMEALVHPEYREIVFERSMARQNGQIPPSRYEFAIVTKSGETRFLEFSGVAFQHDGRPAVLCTALDISERKRIEQALRKSEEKYAKLFKYCPDSVTIASLETGELIEANDGFETMFDYSYAGAVGKDSVSLGIWGDSDCWDSMVSALREKGGLRNWETSFRTRAGSLRQIQTSVDLLELDGQPCILAVSRDISEGVKCRLELVKSEQRYRSLVESAPAAVVMIDISTGRFVDVNSSTVQLFGYSTEELLALGPIELSPEYQLDGRSSLQAYDDHSRALAQGEVVSFEWTHINRRGDLIPVDVCLVPLQQTSPNLVRGRIIDLRERRRLEMLFRQVIDLVPHEIFAKDDRGVYLLSNFKHARGFGLEPSEVVGRRELELSPNPEEVRRFLGDDKEVIRTGKPMLIKEESYTNPEGEVVYYRTEKIPFSFGPNGELGVLGVAIDISEEKRSEARIRASEEKHRRFVETAQEGIIATDSEGYITFVNARMADMLGYPLGRVMNTHLFKFLDSESEKAASKLLKRVEQGQSETVEFRFQNCDSHAVWTMLSISPVYGTHQEFLSALLMFTDITERKRADEALIQSRAHLRELAQRLNNVREEESIRLSRELHDDLGQPLTAMKFEVEWLRRHVQSGQVPTASSIKERCVSLSRLIGDSIGATRRLCAELRPRVLDELGLVSALEWQTHEFETRFGIECSIQTPVHDIRLNEKAATALFRIFQEALTNVARHAKASRISVRLVEQGHVVTLTVADNGKGFASSPRSRTSLGLIHMQERALAVNGNTDVSNAPGGGTIVSVAVPTCGPGCSPIQNVSIQSAESNTDEDSNH